MGRQTNFARGLESAVRHGIELANLRKIYQAWAREEAEAIDVIEQVGRYLEILK